MIEINFFGNLFEGTKRERERVNNMDYFFWFGLQVSRIRCTQKKVRTQELAHQVEVNKAITAKISDGIN